MRRKTKNQAGKEFQAESSLTEIRRINIEDLSLDDRNANQGTALGKKLLHGSIERYGVGRGVLVDKDLKIIAGNHAVKEMKAQGIENVIIVPTQRTDVDKDSKIGHELAIADNRVNQVNLSFDVDLIRELKSEFDLDLIDLDVDISESENDTDGYSDKDDYTDNDNSKGGGGESIDESSDQEFYPVTVTLTKFERFDFDRWKKVNNVTTDTEAFHLMFKKVTE